MAEGINAETVLAAMREAGHSDTLQRRAVIRVMVDSSGWLRPEDVHQRAKTFCPAVGLVTTYRTLSLLSELGFIRRIHFADGCHGYARTGLSHGHHLVCRLCQGAVEFPGTENIDPWVAQISKKTGFLVEDHILELLGVCPTCQVEENPSS